MRILFVFLGWLFFTNAVGQASLDSLVATLSGSSNIPPRLLAERTAVFYSPTFSEKELTECQTFFKNTGLDAEVYFSLNHVSAGVDFRRAVSNYLTKRDFRYLLFLQKKDSAYSIIITPYSQPLDYIKGGQAAWIKKDNALKPILIELFQEAQADQKKLNNLINELPEQMLPPAVQAGERNENFTRSVLVSRMAVPKTKNAAFNQQVKEFLDSRKWKWNWVEWNVPDGALKENGYAVVLRFAYAPAKDLWDLLRYDNQKIFSAIAGIQYVNDKREVVSTPLTQWVYKFYVKHLEFNDLFLGKEWDAAPTIDAAFQNHMKQLMEAFPSSMK